MDFFKVGIVNTSLLSCLLNLFRGRLTIARLESSVLPYEKLERFISKDGTPIIKTARRHTCQTEKANAMVVGKVVIHKQCQVKFDKRKQFVS